MKNMQTRVVPAHAELVGHLMEGVADPTASVWPSPAWPPLILHNGLEAGSRGGHGPLGYAVTEHDVGRRIVFAFDAASGLAGVHEFSIRSFGADQSLVTHTISARTTGQMRWMWPLVVRWFHEALTRDLFDNIERASAGRLSHPPARWSVWVLALRRMRALQSQRQAATTGRDRK